MIDFYKYHGTGNDFIILSTTAVLGEDYAQFVQKICHRKFGIGADGVMMIDESNFADIKMHFFNADGTRATMCGNGIRCFAKHVYDLGLITRKQFTIETDAGVMGVIIHSEGGNESTVSVNLGKPLFKNKYIPNTDNQVYMNQPINVNGTVFWLNSVVIGTIHTVIFVEKLDLIDIAILGERIGTHPTFPYQTNVNFCEIISSNTIRVATWEKGVGVTLACGTGATAAVIIAQLLELCDKTVHVAVSGGELMVMYDDENYYLCGQATYVCHGKYS